MTKAALLSCAVFAIDEGFVVAEGGEAATGPLISQMGPSAGLPGTVVTITGANFGAMQGSSLVVVDGVYAIGVSWSSTDIVVPVPDGARSGAARVVVNGQPSNGAYYQDLSAADVPQP